MQDKDIKRIQRILRQAKSRVFSLTSALSAAPSYTASSKQQITFKNKSSQEMGQSLVQRKDTLDSSPLICDLSCAVYSGFKNEVLSKLYTKTQNERFPSLMTLASFAVGTLAPIQDVSGDHGNVMQEELFYSLIPFHFKRCLIILFDYFI